MKKDAKSGAVSLSVSPAYKQGVEAYRGGIAKEDAPMDKADPAYKDWLAGYEWAKGD